LNHDRPWVIQVVCHITWYRRQPGWHGNHTNTTYTIQQPPNNKQEVTVDQQHTKNNKRQTPNSRRQSKNNAQKRQTTNNTRQRRQKQIAPRLSPWHQDQYNTN
jgi:hypothetical protein